MSIRSASAPLSFAMYRETAPGWHSHSPESGPLPHGHGFEAATSMKRQGSETVPVVLVTVTTPSSSGTRSASSASRRNSPSSSRKRTPRCARVTSPGRGGDPPPTSARPETV